MPIKETNVLLSKGMCVLLFDVFNGCSLVKKINRRKNVKHLLLTKTDILKTC